MNKNGRFTTSMAQKESVNIKPSRIKVQVAILSWAEATSTTSLAISSMEAVVVAAVAPISNLTSVEVVTHLATLEAEVVITNPSRKSRRAPTSMRTQK